MVVTGNSGASRAGEPERRDDSEHHDSNDTTENELGLARHGFLPMAVAPLPRAEGQSNGVNPWGKRS